MAVDRFNRIETSRLLREAAAARLAPAAKAARTTRLATVMPAPKETFTEGVSAFGDRREALDSVLSGIGRSGRDEFALDLDLLG